MEPAAFIRAHTRLRPVPHAPAIRLHVADEATELWSRTEEELGAIGLPPPFWAFAWAGGQALARYVLDHPETVAGARVLDFASGSGLVAIAAAMAGAAAVRASDLDPFALAAIGLNAAENGVAGRVEAAASDLVGRDEGWDCVLAADIFYERDLAARVSGWLEGLHARGARVLIGDPGRAYLPRSRLVSLATYAVPVTRALEDAEIKETGVWRFAAGGGPDAPAAARIAAGRGPVRRTSP
ncbi:Ribosomal RNA small subunit methyltransferase C [Methylobacterium crusticola]|uniref:Ribosomal RNA small subunit methyltransferase C n=1 Tax=Methylobacterium crusticola TaxID=1697972 RepID=A0ABQ4R371_9HYPH|nr:methyltransferase [Methylobacterium crusticola]GJD51887.1 Ribosomal RNA small subunit methyltransferase C [Methylobacterium crusticola]